MVAEVVGLAVGRCRIVCVTCAHKTEFERVVPALVLHCQPVLESLPSVAAMWIGFAVIESDQIVHELEACELVSRGESRSRFRSAFNLLDFRKRLVLQALCRPC